MAVLLAGLAVAMLVPAGGREDPRPTGLRSGTSPLVVGSGARSAQILPGRGSKRRPTVIFMHGWGLTGPDAYSGWLRHLTARGSSVIVPRYQRSTRTPSREILDNALSGARSALRRLRPRPERIVVVGHSVGGVLAVDYAARADALGLPPAHAVMVVYPGGELRRMPAVPEVDPALVPPTVRHLLVLASPTDRVVGTATAAALVEGAVGIDRARRRLGLVDGAGAGDHFAPVLDTKAARETFWRPLDELLSDVGARATARRP